MASLCRIGSRLLRRTVTTTGVRTMGGHAPGKDTDVFSAPEQEVRVSVQAFNESLQGQKKIDVSREEIREALGQTVGDLRFELLEKLRGASDPFDINVQSQNNRGSLEEPILVPTANGTRLIGCVCEEDDCDINWLRLYSAEKKKCGCGFWFQLVDIEGASSGHH